MLPLPMPKFRPKKKHISYGSAPKHLVEAIRKELRRLVDEPDLDANLGMIGRFANEADDMLSMIKSPEAVMRDEHEITLPGVIGTASNVETYGANILRQIIPALKDYQRAQTETPESLTYAIATARRAGMTDLAAELEKKLLGKALDGDRPVVGAATSLPSIQSYLLAADAESKGGGKKKKNGKHVNGKAAAT